LLLLDCVPFCPFLCSC